VKIVAGTASVRIFPEMHVVSLATFRSSEMPYSVALENIEFNDFDRMVTLNKEKVVGIPKYCTVNPLGTELLIYPINSQDGELSIDGIKRVFL
jgi:hypothetical protein